MLIPSQSALTEIRFLVLDGQTTGASPTSGCLIELGWGVAVGSFGDIDVHTALLRISPDTPFPKRVQKLTGIGAQQLQKAVSPCAAWSGIAELAMQLAAQQGLTTCPTLIHYARFEKPFVEALHRECQPDQPFPLDIFCTHHMARMLLPNLPRKGLRAVAGFLGHTPSPLKRSAAHVTATATIWHQFVPRLQDQGIKSLPGLRDWLHVRRPLKKAAFAYPMSRNKRLSLPETPGIYRFFGTDGALLYIGKARSLRKRVNSYFQKKRHHSESNLEMLSQAVDIDFTPTATALEAALIESEQIKQLAPVYNNALTTGDRQLYYVSRNFGSHHSSPSRHTPLGPVPMVDLFSALSLVAEYWTEVEKAHTTLDATAYLAMPLQYAPDQACLVSGLKLFKDTHGHLTDPVTALQALLRIGRRSWIARRQQALEGAETKTDADPQGGVQWTPEAVVRSIESMARRAGFLLRRARWLTLLSESTVNWRLAGKNPETRQIRITNGTLSETLHGVPGANVFDWRQRQGCFDIDTYDRLRVLTTEIRRLLSENRRVSVQLHPLGCIGKNRLGKLFTWI